MLQILSSKNENVNKMHGLNTLNNLIIHFLKTLFFDSSYNLNDVMVTRKL